MSSTLAILSGLTAAIFSGVLAVGVIALAILNHDGLGERYAFEECEIYITGEATPEEANKLGEYLLEIEYFGDANRFSVQLDKENNQPIVRFVVNKLGWTDTDLESQYRALKFLMQTNVFEGNEIRFELVDTGMDFKKLIE